VVRDGLVVYLDAANPKSYPGNGTTWKNTISVSHNAILVNGPTHNSSGGYFSFDGVNQYATHSLPSFNTGNGTMYSFEVWFSLITLPTAQYGSNGHIWGGRNGDNLVLYVNPQVSGTSRLIMVYDDSRYRTSGSGHFSNGSIGANSWVQWVIVGDGSNNTITHYINGKLDNFQGSVQSDQFVRNWPSASRIANDTRWNTFTNMDISILRQYSKKLTNQEVKQNFEATRGRYGI
jgi:hypothetical protein